MEELPQKSLTTGKEKKQNQGKFMNDIKLFVGCDPDTKYSAFGTINLAGDEINAWTVRSKTSDELVQCRSHLAENGAELYDSFIAMVEGRKYIRPKTENLILNQIPHLKSSWLVLAE